MLSWGCIWRLKGTIALSLGICERSTAVLLFVTGPKYLRAQDVSDITLVGKRMKHDVKSSPSTMNASLKALKKPIIPVETKENIP